MNCVNHLEKALATVNMAGFDLWLVQKEHYYDFAYITLPTTTDEDKQIYNEQNQLQLEAKICRLIAKGALIGDFRITGNDNGLGAMVDEWTS